MTRLHKSHRHQIPSSQVNSRVITFLMIKGLINIDVSQTVTLSPKGIYIAERIAALN